MMIPGGYEKHFPVMLHECWNASNPKPEKFMLMPLSETAVTARRFWMPPTVG